MQDALGKLMLLPLCGLGWVYALSPVPLRQAMAWLVSRVPKMLRVREKIARQNLVYAFPGNTPEARARRERLVSDSYLHLGYLFFEMCMVLGPASAMAWFARERVDFRGLKYWKDAFDQGRGVIFLSSHVGSWEIMAASGGVRGMRALIVTKRIKPAWLHDWIEKGRRKCSVEGAYEPKTLSRVLKHLQRGETVGFVLDQYAGPPIGVRVPLFGIPVGTANVVAAIARRTGAPVLPVVSYRTPDGKIRVDVGPPIAFEELEEQARELAHNTARYVSILEKEILAHPDQWLWIHRRFKGDLSPLKPGEWNQARARK